MTLRATAFLGIWHDIDPDFDIEWHRWHTFEHMPERAAVPGFKTGRRYMHQEDALQRCFTLYEAEALATFRSPPYLARLDAPTEWTRRMMPSFRNLVRGACEVVASRECVGGYGGAVQTIRLEPPEDEPDFAGLVTGITELDDVLAAHVGVCRHEATRADTSEASMRTQTTEEKFGAVVIVECIDRARLAACEADLHRQVAAVGCQVEASLGYELAFVLGTQLA